MTPKVKVLLVGSGGVGTMAAYNLEIGGLATVTAVLRSNYQAVMENGFTITSIDHGHIKGWKPTHITNTIPNISITGERYDLLLVTTKNIPDVSPTVVDLIAPAITPSHTTIMLLQNGLNIEKPLIAAFPTNPILSGVSLIGAAESEPGHIIHDDRDRITVGPYLSPEIPKEVCIQAATDFVLLYGASEKVVCEYGGDVAWCRWRKLVYNASYNGACAITGMDTSSMRMVGFPIEEVIRPLMVEIVGVARAAGHVLPEGIIEDMINCDPWDTFFKPSMQQDIEKGNFIEFENIVGEPLREAERLGVPAPGLKILYGLLKIKQFQLKQKKGIATLPTETPVTQLWPMLHIEEKNAKNWINGGPARGEKRVQNGAWEGI